MENVKKNILFSAHPHEYVSAGLVSPVYGWEHETALIYIFPVSSVVIHLT